MLYPFATILVMDAHELKRKFRKAFSVYSRISSKRNIYGFTPSFIVGESGYPNVPIFFMSSEIPMETNPERLFGKGLEELVGIRMGMVGSLKTDRIFSQVREEISMSVKPPETEVKLKSRPLLRTRMGFHQPLFVQARLKDMRVNSFKIPEKLEKIVNDELKATEMASIIYRKYGIQKAHDLMAGGFLGIRKRMVPTRWAITSVDDALGKEMMRKVREFRIIDKPESYFISYLGNRFLLLLLPSEWGFELVEKWLDSSPIHDWEGFYGRKTYASSTEGAYYAARLAVLEHLIGRKKQAKVILLRMVSSGYSVPMGVWVIRESVRHMFSQRIDIEFPTLEGMPSAFKELLDVSILWRRHITQKRLTEF